MYNPQLPNLFLPPPKSCSILLLVEVDWFGGHYVVDSKYSVLLVASRRRSCVYCIFIRTIYYSEL
jgi:hypothetical protein